MQTVVIDMKILLLIINTPSCEQLVRKNLNSLAGIYFPDISTNFFIDLQEKVSQLERTINQISELKGFMLAVGNSQIFLKLLYHFLQTTFIQFILPSFNVHFKNLL